MTPDHETDALDCTSLRCEDCSPNVRWERRDVSVTAEAWLGICDVCGSMKVLALGVAPDVTIEDPLAFFLLGGPRYEPKAGRPAWQRFYETTLDAPFNLKWRFEVDPCDACEARSSVGRTIFTPRGRRFPPSRHFARPSLSPTGSGRPPITTGGGGWPRKNDRRERGVHHGLSNVQSTRYTDHLEVLVSPMTLPPSLSCPHCERQAPPTSEALKIAQSNASVSTVFYRCGSGHLFAYSPISGRIG